jgi:DNA repair protein RecN (Recombination protein N)
LSMLSGRAQTLCITHLPQIAARGNVHFFIEKRAHGKRTAVSVHPLHGDERIAEIARMLGGDATDAVMKHARELLMRSNDS